MSLALLTDDVLKPWLDARVNNLKIDGAISVSSSYIPYETAVQGTSQTTAVDVSASDNFIIETYPLTVAAQSVATFSVNNPNLAIDDMIMVSQFAYAGNAGIPHATLGAKNNGVCTLSVYNAHDTNALNGKLYIQCMAYHKQ